MGWASSVGGGGRPVSASEIGLELPIQHPEPAQAKRAVVHLHSREDQPWRFYGRQAGLPDAQGVFAELRGWLAAPLTGLGLMAIGPEQEEPVTVEFDYFHLEGDEEEPPADTTAPVTTATWSPNGMRSPVVSRS